MSYSVSMVAYYVDKALRIEGIDPNDLPPSERHAIERAYDAAAKASGPFASLLDVGRLAVRTTLGTQRMSELRS